MGLQRRRFRALDELIARTISERLRPGGSVIDVGCGLGQQLQLLQARRPDAELTFADPYPICLQTTARFVRGQSRLIPERGLRPTDLGGPFDAVIASHVLEHSVDPFGFAGDLLGVCRPGGTVVFAVPNLARPKVLWYAARRQHYANRGHLMGWDHSHWRLFVEAVRRDDDVVSYLHDEVHVFPAFLASRAGSIRAIERRLAGALPWWSFSNVAAIRAATGLAE